MKEYKVSDQQAIDAVEFICKHAETLNKDLPKIMIISNAMVLLAYAEEREGSKENIPIALFEKASPHFRFIMLLASAAMVIEATK